MYESESEVVSHSLRPRGLQPTRLLRPWDSPGKNTGVGCHFLLQGTFLTQGLNPGLLHHRQILCCLNQQDIYMATHLEIITKIKATFTIYNNTL